MLTKRLWAMAGAVLATACSGSGTSDSSSPGGASSGDGAYTEHPIVCDAPMCDADESLYALSVTPAPVEMRVLGAVALRAEIAGQIAGRLPEMVLIAHWLQGTPTGEPALDEALRAHPAPREGRDALIAILDQEFAGWRELGEVPWPSGADPEDSGPFETAWQGLETSGCGEMRLQMALGSVTVHQRDDNFSDDRVYCIVRATDGNGDMELSQTDVSPPLAPEGTHYYSDGTFFGRGEARDPGASLKVEYDCWEMDDESEYERFEQILDAVMQASKLLPPGQIKGAIVLAGKVAGVLIKLGKLFDGDDYLFQTVENFTRQDLWVLAATQPQRSFTARGNHYGSAWSWEFSVLADACAVGANAGPGSVGGYDGGGTGGGTDAPATCAGCWVGSSCEDGNANDACGTGGSDCTSCERLESCESGACRFDSSRTVDVEAVSARVPATDSNGSDWDIFGDSAPEVLMRIAVGGRTGSTNPVEGYAVSWNTLVRRDVRVSDLMDSVEVELIDNDEAAGEEWMDGCHGAVSRAEIEAGEVTWGCGSSEVTLGFR